MKKHPVRLPEGLMAKLARVLNVDLFSLQETGRISSDAVARMQTRCSLCSDPGKCGRQIDLEGGDMERPPEFCPNRKIFEELSKHEEAHQAWPIYGAKERS